MIQKVSNRYFRFYLSEISMNRKLNNRPPFIFKDKFYECNIKPFFSFLSLNSYTPSLLSNKLAEYSSSRSVREAINIIMCDKLAHTISHQSLENTLASFSLRKIPARGDGHCILHSWEINTGIVQSEIKEKLVVEYLGEPLLYSTYDVSFDELNQYLNLRNYSLNTVDSILPMLCNVFNHAAYIFSETVSGNGKERSTLIQLINPKFSGTKSENFAFLLKNDDHYDGLVF